MQQKEHRRFKRFVVVTVISVYLLILAGGIVRTTGSGMGCPDWPKCFGVWVPPLEESELPPDYKEKYTVHGYETEFNAVKTWIEYINRLLGALIGVFILTAFVLSFRYKSDKVVMPLCGLALLLVILEGIVGKYVVSTNLKPLLISFHLWGSILVILLLIYVMSRVRRSELKVEYIADWGKMKIMNVLLIGFTVLQMVIGTQVRQQIDVLSSVLGFDRRSEWIAGLNYILELHRYYSIFLFFFTLYFVYRLYQSGDSTLLKRIAIGIFSLVVIEIIGGVIMGNFNIPAYIQPIHMLVATVLLGVQFFSLVVVEFNKKESLH
jgi:heme a synthase